MLCSHCFRSLPLLHPFPSQLLLLKHAQILIIEQEALLIRQQRLQHRSLHKDGKKYLMLILVVLGMSFNHALLIKICLLHDKNRIKT